MNGRIEIERIERGLQGTRFAGIGRSYDVVDSTNDTLQELARAGAVEGSWLMAAEQAAGRGRRGRNWSSVAGIGLYLSVLFRPAAASPAQWTLGAAVAACDACRTFGAARVTIKWPNDLLAGGRKLAGILVDTRSSGDRIRDLVIGLGVNVRHDDAQLDALAPAPATSLRAEGADTSGAVRERLAVEFLHGLEAIAQRLEEGAWETVAEAWLERAPLAAGAPVTVHPAEGDPWPGNSAGLAGDGALRVRDAGGRTHLVRQVDSVSFDEEALACS